MDDFHLVGVEEVGDFDRLFDVLDESGGTSYAHLVIERGEATSSRRYKI